MRHSLSYAKGILQGLASKNTWAFCNVCKPAVAHPTMGVVPFIPWSYQRELMRSLDRGGPHIILKARQIGISTAVMIQKLRRCLEAPGRTIVTVSINQDKAAELNRIALTAVNSGNFPLRLIRQNASELEFENGSRIKTQPATEGTARGLAGSDIVLDEFAFWPLQEEIWRAARPAASRGANVTVISTPDMEGDRFATLWQQAQSGLSGWKAFRLPWRSCPDYDEAWYAANRPDYTEAEWRSEFECEFMGASEAVFSPQAIEAAMALWRKYAPRSPVSRYCAGVDVAGEGRDETVITLIDASQQPYLVVEQRTWSRLPAPELQAEIERLYAQTQASIAIDYTGIGYGVAQNLNIPHHRITFTGGRDVSGIGSQLNVPRSVLLSNTIHAFERGAVGINPDMAELVQALRTARWGSKRVERFPDRLDSLLLALWEASPRTGRAGLAIPDYQGEALRENRKR